MKAQMLVCHDIIRLHDRRYQISMISRPRADRVELELTDLVSGGRCSQTLAASAVVTVL